MAASTTGSSAAPDPRRLTPTQRLHEVTLAAVNRKPSEPESSVTVSRNAKGHFQFEVTVRGADAQACKEEADYIIDSLEARYPYPAVNGGSE